MIRRIYKYTLKLQDEQDVSMPLGAVLLSIQEQHGNLTVWAHVDPSEKTMVDKRFRIYGTGHDIDWEDGRLHYAATVQSGAMVWHVFTLDNIQLNFSARNSHDNG